MLKAIMKFLIFWKKEKPCMKSLRLEIKESIGSDHKILKNKILKYCKNRT